MDDNDGEEGPFECVSASARRLVFPPGMVGNLCSVAYRNYDSIVYWDLDHVFSTFTKQDTKYLKRLVQQLVADRSSELGRRDVHFRGVNCRPEILFAPWFDWICFCYVSM